VFLALLAAGLDKSRHPDLEVPARDLGTGFLQPARLLCPGDAEAAARLTCAVVAIAHGFATPLLDGALGGGDEAVERATEQAAAATLAVIAGRKALRSPGAAPIRPRVAPTALAAPNSRVG